MVLNTYPICCRYRLFGLTKKMKTRDHFIGYFKKEDHWFKYNGMSKEIVTTISYDEIEEDGSLEHIIVFLL